MFARLTLPRFGQGGLRSSTFVPGTVESRRCSHNNIQLNVCFLGCFCRKTERGSVMTVNEVSEPLRQTPLFVLHQHLLSLRLISFVFTPLRPRLCLFPVFHPIFFHRLTVCARSTLHLLHLFSDELCPYLRSRAEAISQLGN